MPSCLSTTFPSGAELYTTRTIYCSESVFNCMLTQSKHYKIFFSIVVSLAVQMMNMLIRFKKAAHFLFYYKAMFEEIATMVSVRMFWGAYHDVTMMGHISTNASRFSYALVTPNIATLVRRIFRFREKFRTSTSADCWFHYNTITHTGV